MSQDRVHLSNHDIDRLTYHISFPSEKIRDEVRGVLKSLAPAGIGRLELHETLMRLRHMSVISEADVSKIEEAIFKD